MRKVHNGSLVWMYLKCYGPCFICQTSFANMLTFWQSAKTKQITQSYFPYIYDDVIHCRYISQSLSYYISDLQTIWSTCDYIKHINSNSINIKILITYIKLLLELQTIIENYKLTYI